MIGMQNERQRNQEHSEERKAVNSRMGINIKRTLKNVIAFVAIANIIAMMVFQYGLPSNAAVGNGSNSKEHSSEESGMGTIESVEKETAAKEEEEAQTLLAREEESPEPEEPEEEIPEALEQPVVGQINSNADTLFLRSGPDKSYNIIFELPKGDFLMVTHMSENWCKIIYEGREGYCMRQFLILPDEN